MQRSDQPAARRLSWLGSALMILGTLLLIVTLYQNRMWPFRAQEPEPFRNPTVFAVDENQPPEDKLFITPERQAYVSESLRLVVPKLNLDLPIQNGVDDMALEQGPGLYDYAQLPGTGNRNVSIAGHRDIHGAPFYGVHTLGEGDYFYLLYEDTIYRYTYRSTTIVAEDDWGPIFSQGFSCLTLTSCDPIGTTLHRIIIQAELSERTPYRGDYQFLPALEA